MAQSLAHLLIHLVFSTKHRVALLADEDRDELHACIGEIVKYRKGALLSAGSVADHIHLLVAQPRTCSVSDLIQDIKADSSAWLKTKGADYSDFHWQAGFGAFSISPTHRPVLEKYIAGQADHHRKFSYQDEFRRLLNEHGIQFDERYVWD